MRSLTYGVSEVVLRPGILSCLQIKGTSKVDQWAAFLVEGELREVSRKPRGQSVSRRRMDQCVKCD